MGILNGKVAIITGTSSGIGAAIATRFVAEGATVIAVSRSKTTIDGVSWRQTDVSDSADVNSLIAETLAELGRLDAIVNNAGVQLEKSIVETSDADFDWLMGVNLRGVFNVCRAGVGAMSADRPEGEAKGGSIVNIGSTAATHSDHGLAIYNASKAAVHALTRSIALDHGHQGIRCNTVAPGWVMTALAEAAFEATEDPTTARAAAEAKHPVGRLGRPEDIAGITAWLCSNDAGYATGAVFTIDGGLTTQSPVGPG